MVPMMCGGVVTLFGSVSTENARATQPLEAAIAARSTPGVRAVEDDLRMSAAAPER